jgi:hypothetical protein
MYYISLILQSISLQMNWFANWCAHVDGKLSKPTIDQYSIQMVPYGTSLSGDKAMLLATTVECLSLLLLISFIKFCLDKHKYVSLDDNL